MTWYEALIDFIEELVPEEFVTATIRQAMAGPGLSRRQLMEERKRSHLDVPRIEMTRGARI